jgi:hypothetical protein
MTIAWIWVFLPRNPVSSDLTQVAQTIKTAPPIPPMRVTQKASSQRHPMTHGSVTRHVTTAAKKATSSLIAAACKISEMALALAKRHNAKVMPIWHNKLLRLPHNLLSYKLSKSHQKTDGQLAS